MAPDLACHPETWSSLLPRSSSKATARPGKPSDASLRTHIPGSSQLSPSSYKICRVFLFSALWVARKAGLQTFRKLCLITRSEVMRRQCPGATKEEFEVALWLLGGQVTLLGRALSLVVF
uniref:Uncharacterized protein n=1 Tax=Panagrellus redivivus TaxID=6233 RepID=A0A7E5A242_PANRE